MSADQVQQGNTTVIGAVFYAPDFSPVTGLTPTIRIMRTTGAPDHFWSGTGYVNADPALPMVELGNNTDGLYIYSFNTAGGTGAVLGQHFYDWDANDNTVFNPTAHSYLEVIAVPVVLAAADVTNALIAQGLTATFINGQDDVRKLLLNKSVINGTGPYVRDTYNDNQTSVAFQHSLSADEKTREPV